MVAGPLIVSNGAWSTFLLCISFPLMGSILGLSIWGVTSKSEPLEPSLPSVVGTISNISNNTYSFNGVYENEACTTNNTLISPQVGLEFLGVFVFGQYCASFESYYCCNSHVYCSSYYTDQFRKLLLITLPFY
jgi:hypothetical protein